MTAELKSARSIRLTDDKNGACVVRQYVVVVVVDGVLESKSYTLIVLFIKVRGAYFTILSVQIIVKCQGSQNC